MKRLLLQNVCDLSNNMNGLRFPCFVKSGNAEVPYVLLKLLTRPRPAAVLAATLGPLAAPSRPGPCQNPPTAGSAAAHRAAPYSPSPPNSRIELLKRHENA